MNKLEFSIESFKNIQDLIKFSDQKAGAILVITGLILTVFLNFSKDLFFVSINDSSVVGVVVFIFGITTLSGLFSVIYVSIYKILRPRLAKNYKNNEFSLFYFEHISELGKEELYLKYEEINDEAMLKLVLDQQFEVSNILKQKISALNHAFELLFLSVVSLSIFVVLAKAM